MVTQSQKAISDRGEMKLGELLVGMRSIRITAQKDGTEAGLGVPEAESVTKDELFEAVRVAHQKESLGRDTIHGLWKQCHLL